MFLSNAARSALLLLLFTQAGVAAVSHSHADDVDPMIGTDGGGQTTPNVGVPFGMTQWTPATRNGEVRLRAPYYYKDTELVGLRGSHFLSGSGTKDYGSFQLLAGMGAPDLSKGYLSTRLDHHLEESHPYLYKVTLPESGIQVSMTGTTRCGLLRFQFTRTGHAWISLQNEAAIGDGSLTVNNDGREIRGENRVRRIYAGAGKPAGFSGYTIAQFSRASIGSGSWTGDKVQSHVAGREFTTTDEGIYLQFDVKAGDVIEARVATSFVSVEEAARNLSSEIHDWSFSKIEAASRAQWDRQLNTIDIDADEANRRIFYTALYHASQLPRIVNDVSGTYPRFASQGEVEHIYNADYYDDFSLWDTFRALHPLLTLIDPKRESAMVQSLILKGQQGGYLPMFPAWNSYTQEMLGDHAVAVIGDAYQKGLRGFDMQAAYTLMRQSALTTPSDPAKYRDGQGRRGLESYLRYGYIPLEDRVSYAFHDQGQVSRTLEYAYDDFVLSEVAKSLGKQDDAYLFAARAQNFRNVIFPDTGFARGRHQDGSWDTPFDPDKPHAYFIESSAAQNAFFVLQDIPGLIALEGGAQKFDERLDDLFRKDQYDQGNEPSHHIAYLYDYAGEPWKTQEHVSYLRDSLYKNGPAGLPGNDDAGQMSAWYIFAALGFYPVTPGLPSYAIGTPLFKSAIIHLANGKMFHLQAERSSSHDCYIQSISLNGKPMNGFVLTHAAIESGGTLVFHLSDHPAP